MIKKLLFSLFIIAAVGGTSIAATRALLSDQAVLSENTFSTGTVGLLVAKGQSGGTFQEETIGFEATLLPGETFTNYFRLKNDSPDAHFSIAAQATEVGGSITSDDVIVSFTPVNSSEDPIGATVTKTLAEWEASPASLGLPNIADGATQEYQIDVTLDDDVASGGATTEFDFVFTGTQIIP
ncbi:MAG TPA: hypothetical protein VLF20_01455 [Patescibacteria group bacterium]|nr:hypothetical protein [Patescibacteria group bacterium]